VLLLKLGESPYIIVPYNSEQASLKLVPEYDEKAYLICVGVGVVV
jgi:hypothetical protein